MGDRSAIGWCDATWVPLTGCTRVSAGCDHCYAFTLHNRRYRDNVRAALRFGDGEEPVHAPDMLAYLRRVATEPRAGLPQPIQYDLPFAKVQLLPDRLDQPLRWRKPRRIFVTSMGDLFHEAIPDGSIYDVFDTMARAHQHTFQVLTKRPERMRDFCQRIRYIATNELAHLTEPGVAWNPGASTFEARALPNVWLGVSVEDQQTADERIPLLLETPAAVRWISAEPLLGPVDLTMFIPEQEPHRCPSDITLDWVVVGGESGRNYRPMGLAWARSLREQCRAAGVAYFGKQNSGPRQGIPLPDEDGLSDKEFPA